MAIMISHMNKVSDWTSPFDFHNIHMIPLSLEKDQIWVSQRFMFGKWQIWRSQCDTDPSWQQLFESDQLENQFEGETTTPEGGSIRRWINNKAVIRNNWNSQVEGEIRKLDVKENEENQNFRRKGSKGGKEHNDKRRQKREASILKRERRPEEVWPSPSTGWSEPQLALPSSSRWDPIASSMLSGKSKMMCT